MDDASANASLYADLRKPQSLNKYQYAYNNPLRWIDPDGHDPEDENETPDPPQGKSRGTSGTNGVPVPLGPGVTPAEAQQTADILIRLGKAIWEAPDPYLYPVSQTIGTAPDPTTDPVPIPPLLPVPLSPTAPIQNRKNQDFTPSDKRKVDAKSGNKCADCEREVRPVQNKKGVPTPADQRHVHHDKPKSQGGTRELNNAVPLCPSCHKERHRKMREGNKGTL